MRSRPDFVLLLLFATTAASAFADGPSAGRIAELENLLRHDCGACHGLTLKGGLGPPLVAAAMKDRQPNVLLDTILDGRPGTAMPPWRPFLSRGDARWLVERLRRGEAP